MPAAPPGPAPTTGFARGTRIATARGLIAVESLRPGDVLATASGALPLLWAGRSEPAGPLLRLAAHGLGPGLPGRALTLGPGQRLLLAGGEVEVLFGLWQALCPARSLAHWRGLSTVPAAPLHHLLLAEPAAILAEGLGCESLWLGERDGARALVPAGLRLQLAESHHFAACPSVEAWEARLLASPAARRPAR